MSKKYLTGSLLLAGLFFAATSAHADEWTKKYTLSGKGEVRAQTSDGNVDVRTGSGNAVNARVTTTGWRIGPEQVRVTERQIGNRVEMEVHLPHFNWNVGNHSVHIELSVPRECDLDIRTSDGNITTEGVKGELRLSSGDGNIRGASLEGALDAGTGDGNLTVDGRFDRLNLKSGDGRIEVHVNSGSRMTQDWSLRSGDGDVTLRLPGNFAADLNLHTGDGHIQLGFPITTSGSIRESDIHGKLNGGGLTLTVHTGDGSIHLEKF
ncbi:MAG TPA: DUF4097 family beta strand repeat-containing protein [Terriglobia bacterium]|nr:DUF4097 family beta strand repeat-containing protein [Terriglobia bacterium]